MVGKSNTVRKSILRNTEIPVNPTKKVEKQVRIDSESWIVKENTKKAPVTKPLNKFTKPTINSTARISQKIKDVVKGKGFDKTKTQCITSTSAALMQEKLTQTLNFPAHRNVFRGLCPVNVNDSVLEIDIEKTRPRNVFAPVQPMEKDPEPELLHFLDPVEPFEYDDMESDVLGVGSLPLKHSAPICTTLGNIQTIFDCIY